MRYRAAPIEGNENGRAAVIGPAVARQKKGPRSVASQ
jgi:hypothetical protein